MSGYKGCYQRAYRCLGAAAEIMEDQRAALLTDALSHKLAKRARGILSREVPKQQKAEQPGQVKQRFLGAVTHRGPICLYHTALVQCEKIYALSDNYSLAHELLIHLLAGITGNGYDVIACPDPMSPERLAHLLVPELKLAFLTVDGTPQEITPYRRIRLDMAADGETLRRSRPRLRFARKVSAALVEEAVSSLAQAKAMHDDLESIYNPYVDFDLVDKMAQNIWEEILTF